jgi:hypothetical protein
MSTRTLVIALALCSCLHGTRASAQVSRLGDTFLAWSASAKGSAIAYDSRNDVYLAVSSHGAVYGRFLHPDGAPLGQPFLMQAVVYWGHFPHVAYSPDANGGNGTFLVTWLESDGPTAQSPTSLHTRMVSYNSGFLTPDRMIVGHDTYWEIMGAPVAYSTVSREFLVIWRQYFDVNIFGLRLSNSSDPIGGVIPVATSPLYESDPSLTYSPATDEFFAVYRQGLGTVSAVGQRIKAGTGALVGGPSVLGQSADIRTTGVTYNAATGQYLAAWNQMAPINAMYGRIVALDGTAIGNVVALATSFGSYDSLSIDVNDVSGTAFMVGHDKATTEDAGVEIGGNGLPIGSPIRVTATCFAAGGYCPGNGNYYPKVTSHSSRREWMVVTVNRFSTTLAQRIGTATAGGPGQPPPPPPSPTPTLVSNPLMSLDTPSNGASVATQVAITGWAVDLSAPSGSGVDTVHVWALPAGGSWTFLGAASMGVARPDVAGALQSAQMTNAGFGLLATLPPGTYDIAAHAHSVVSNTFNNVKIARVTVVAPPSRPLMHIDLPAPFQTVPQFFVIGGWAIDLAATTGPGVSVIHAWGYPVAGGSPVFAGATTVGGYRPDVAGFAGDPRFGNSGYGLHGSLPRGEYDLVVFAMSTVTGTFNNVAIIRIRVV